MTKVSVTLDWLRYTVHWNTKGLPHRARNWSGSRLANNLTNSGCEWKDVPAHNGYTSSVACVPNPTLTVSWNVTRPDMGVSVDYPGSALAQVEPLFELDHAIAIGGQVSRLDIAVDVDEAWDVEAFREAIKGGQVVTRARKGGVYDGLTGWTAYVGARSSEKFLRIYDKAAETGTKDPWTRIELECKGDYARAIAQLISQEGYGMIPAVIRAFADFPTLPRWVKVMEGGGVYVAPPKVERHSNTRGWLLQQVAPVLARQFIQDPSFYDAWVQRMMGLMPWVDRVGEEDIFAGMADFEVKSS